MVIRVEALAGRGRGDKRRRVLVLLFGSKRGSKIFSSREKSKPRTARATKKKSCVQCRACGRQTDRGRRGAGPGSCENYGEHAAESSRKIENIDPC